MPNITEDIRQYLNMILGILLSIIVGIVVNKLSDDPFIKDTVPYVLYIGSVLLTIILFASWLRKFLITRNTFWKILTVKEKRTIDYHLDEVKAEVQFEFKFDPENNSYIPLAGEPGNPNNLMSQQAQEDLKRGGKRNISNLDTYLLAPSSSRVFIYGPPGSGKSTTLYKAFVNYKKAFSDKIGILALLGSC